MQVYISIGLSIGFDHMTLGARIEERRKAVGINSQAALAREAGLPQSTLNGLINRPYRWSPHLNRIANALQTTVAYLSGETDDPDLNAARPTPPVAPQVMMPVTLPTENALADMFEGLLLAIDRTQSVDAVARELAQLLPTGLSRMQGRLLELPRPPRSSKTPYEPPAAAEALANAAKEHQR